MGEAYAPGTSPVNGNHPLPDLSGIAPSRLYPASAVMAKLSIARNTLTKWVADGLNAYGEGAREDLFLGREVIAYVIAHPKRKDALRNARKRRKRRE